MVRSAAGWFKVSRKLFWDSDLFRQPGRARTDWEAWLELVAMAAHSEHGRTVKGERVPLSRGEFLGSVRFIKTRMNWSVGKAHKFLQKCVSAGRIEKLRETGAGTVYHMPNYEEYQAGGGESAKRATQDDREVDGPQAGYDDEEYVENDACEDVGSVGPAFFEAYDDELIF